MSGLEHEIARARDDVRADFEALGRELGRDEQKIHAYGPYLAAGAGALGLLLGLGGPKWIKRLLAAAIVGGIAAAVMKSRT